MQQRAAWKAANSSSKLLSTTYAGQKPAIPCGTVSSWLKKFATLLQQNSRKWPQNTIKYEKRNRVKMATEKPSNRCGSRVFLGDPAGIRTPDPLLKRQLLCRLSYRVVVGRNSALLRPRPAGRGLRPLHSFLLSPQNLSILRGPPFLRGVNAAHGFAALTFALLPSSPVPRRGGGCSRGSPLPP